VNEKGNSVMAKDITLYGIKSCDTCRKALAWLSAEGIAHVYHDFRKDGLDGAMLDVWIKELGWETLINRRGTTWRKIPETERQDLTPARAKALMLANPTVIKRPVFDLGKKRLVGFTDDVKSGLAGSL
jgi:arsenate reductase